MHWKQVTPDMDRMEEVTFFIEEQLRAGGAPSAVVACVNVAVDEVFSNIVRYSGAGMVRVGFLAEGGRALLLFEDDGVPYDPLAAPEPDIALAARERVPGGLGIYMVKKMMDRVKYAYSGGLNQLMLEKEW